jgi:SAM-dependent methyltransferase
VIRKALPELQLLDGADAWRHRNRILSSFLSHKFGGRSSPLKVLEAGCGRAWPLDLGAARLGITGVDLDSAALDARVREVGDLERAIVGDLREIEFPPNEFDIVYCCEVLEHISGAEDVVQRFMAWLKPGGVAVLVFPDRNTVFGRVTSFSPHWVHVAYHRHVLGSQEAGSPGFPPYRTYYDNIISRHGIHNFCAKHGCRIALEYGRPPGKADWPSWFLQPYKIIAPIISAISGGAIAWTHIGLVYALEKR